MKEFLKGVVQELGYEVFDAGNAVYDENDDYPDFAAEAAKQVSLDYEGSRAVLICGSGAGVNIVANKYPNVRATLGLSTDQVYDARHDDDVNVLCLSSDFTAKPDAQKMVQVFITTPFGGEARHERRLEKIAQIESKAPFALK
ncbi:MAG: RpiB/LacA/LacB family sugar-phosphate isomerase [Candidatus Liptonbacteria bacterium]|nr:RpiB/LacA/LacB family sugar-phosphate isomerase [Candidatus Liptonbacteria bacterium]